MVGGLRYWPFISQEMTVATFVTKGTKIRIKPDQVFDRLPQRLRNQISKDPWGIVVEYKITDGQGLGLVLELEDGSTSWFFNHELDIPLSDDKKHQSITKDENPISDDLSLAGSSIGELLNPLYFWKWLNYSLKDVF